MLNGLDKSNYLRGQIILIRLDRVISEYEKVAIVRMAKILDLSSEFCSDVIEELIYNPYLSQGPPVFSRKEIGESFLDDAIKLAYSDGNLHLDEKKWIKSIATCNRIESGYWLQKLKIFKELSKKNKFDFAFEVEKLMVN